MAVMVNGKELRLKVDFGAVKKLKKEYGVNLLKLKDDDLEDPDSMTAIFYVLALRGGTDITMDEIDSIDFRDITKITDEIWGLMDEFAPEENAVEGANGTVPLVENLPQK